MKKALILAIAASVAGLCVAADSTETNALSKAERRRIRREQRLARDGGLVTKPNLGKTIRFIDVQEQVAHTNVAEAARVVAEVVNMPAEAVRSEAPGDAFELAEKAMKDAKVGAAVLLVADVKLPAVMVAPERSWAVVNVTALARDFPPKEVLAVRARKELVRASAWALGAGESMMKPCIMQYEPTLSALDANRLMVPSPDPVMRMVNGALARGIDTIREDTYRRACQEGWAPPPTNDVQKAIWEETRKVPEKPLKIEFDPAKGK